MQSLSDSNSSLSELLAGNPLSEVDRTVDFNRSSRWPELGRGAVAEK